MKTTTVNASSKKRNPVEVTIAVTKFNDVLATSESRDRCETAYIMKLRRADPRATIKGDNLYIRRPGADLRFTIGAADGAREKYFPVGITFVREGQPSSSDAERLGLRNFPQSDTRSEGKSLVIRDRYRDGRKPVRYKFSVVIQRGSDGKIGIIDPGIIHDDSDGS